MSTNKAKSFNHQVYQKAYKRLNLSPSQRTVFLRLLGFLIRNNKPFPFSAVKMAELTGLDKRTIFRCLDKLEYYRLIKRSGMGKNRRFCAGTILVKIFTTVTCRMNKDLTTATLCHKKLINRDMVSYSKTSLSLKRKEKGFLESINVDQKAQEQAHEKRMKEYEEIINRRKLSKQRLMID